MIWDALHNLRNDYLLLSQHRIEIPTVTYFISRIASLGYILGKTVFLSDHDCQAFEAVLISFFIVSLISNALLPYFRVCAIWDRNRYIIGFFGLTYLSVVVSGLSIITGLKGTNLAGSPHCVDIIVKQTIPASFLTMFAHDTAISLAITYGVCKRNLQSNDLSINRGLCTALLGRSLPAFSKAFLHDSQICYFINVCAYVAMTIWYYTSATDPSSPFRLTFVVVPIMVANIMFGRVFRNTKLGLQSRTAINPQHSMSRMTSVADLVKEEEGQGVAFNKGCDHTRPPKPSSLGHVEISVRKVVEYKRDRSAAVRQYS
ncbi:hypothetical protein B0H34DRAFT_660956 [Crassisporium funariophilum]|nr:hypothetical protein B0H34DRAFT_660956 [Crassisporium funariophilum]